MQAAYAQSPAKSLPDTFVLYRIIGNDLPPRHSPGQARENLEFILRHEAEFSGCEKRWIVNRIVDTEEERRIVALLSDTGQNYLRIPFNPSEFVEIPWDAGGLPSQDFTFTAHFRKERGFVRNFVNLHIRRRKNRYLMNNNGARNAALEDGRKRAKWVLPFDGNCFFTETAFAKLRHSVEAQPWCPYVIVPMARVSDNRQLLDPSFAPDYSEEPQIAFRQDAVESFDPQATYGRRPKIELLWRLGVPGVWDNYNFFDWDIQRPALAPEAGQFQIAGGVVRLDSGKPELETGEGSSADRAVARTEAIIEMIDNTNAHLLARRHRQDRLGFYQREKLRAMPQEDSALYKRLITDAARIKTPSTAPRRIAPPLSRWLRGTNNHPSRRGSDDPVKGHGVFRDVTILALAHAAGAGDAPLAKAADLIRNWLREPVPCEEPDFGAAQALLANAKGSLAQSGYVQPSGLHSFLDAVRILTASGGLSDHEAEAFDNWVRGFHAALHRRCDECQVTAFQHPSHMTWALAELAATASYLGDTQTLAQIRNGVPLRLAAQFTDSGTQHNASQDPAKRVDVADNLEAWSTLLNLLSRYAGKGRWPDEGTLTRLKRGYEWLAQEAATPSGEAELRVRDLEVLWAFYRDFFDDEADSAVPVARKQSNGIAQAGATVTPYWMLSGPHWFDDDATS